MNSDEVAVEYEIIDDPELQQAVLNNMDTDNEVVTQLLENVLKKKNPNGHLEGDPDDEEEQNVLEVLNEALNVNKDSDSNEKDDTIRQTEYYANLVKEKYERKQKRKNKQNNVEVVDE